MRRDHQGSEPPMSDATSSIEYWQRKGHYLHLRTQDGQPYGSERRCCEVCGVMVWPQVQGADTPEWTDDRSAYYASQYRCEVRR